MYNHDGRLYGERRSLRSTLLHAFPLQIASSPRILYRRFSWRQACRARGRLVGKAFRPDCQFILVAERLHLQ
jgi:hypothetical protein